MKILKLDRNNYTQSIEQTIKFLDKGCLVIVPTDTVYGLAVDALSEKAVNKLIAFKNRPPGKPISIFVSNKGMINSYVKLTIAQKKLLNEVLPGPFTVILPSRHRTVKNLESEKGTLGVRIIDNKFIAELVEKFGRPITATSANLSGKTPYHSVRALLKEIPEKKKGMIDLIVDANKLPKNNPSTVMDLTNDNLKIIRQGDVVFKNSTTYFSDSELKTKKVAQSVFHKLVNEPLDKPTVMVLQGELGSGKTVFIKGIAEIFGINNIVSPTYVVFYEYLLKDKFINKLIHFDLYNLHDSEEIKYLHIDRYLRKGNLLCFEWGEKMGELLSLFKIKSRLIYIEMNYLGQNKRKITIRY